MIILLVAGYAGYVQLNLFMRTESVNDCMYGAKVELKTNVRVGQTNYVTTRVQPIKEWFDRCMQAKGYK